MSEVSPEAQRRKSKLSFPIVFLGVLLVIMIVGYVLNPDSSGRQSERLKCVNNLKQLAVGLALYAEDYDNQWPAPQSWCDLLVEKFEGLGDVQGVFRCPLGGDGRCHYAMNPHADPCGPADVVLLFESKPGWNRHGGAELLTTDRHQGANVLLVGGIVKFVKADELVGLKWRDERELPPELRNARRPATDGELKYWLENMIGHHRFSIEEVRAATGLTVEAIEVAQMRFGIRLGDRPERETDGPLLVLPYPGGRHPRIGFLAGAIDPQRETKFSVFAPWDANSYVVVDVPEAIWSNLGLTYLAHTHIDTIWSKQGIELPKLEWTRRADGGLEIKRTLPNGLAFGVEVTPTKEAVHMEMWMKNGTTESLSDLRVQNCVMPKMAAGLAALTNENKILTNPYVACRSTDGKRWVITAWEGCERPWGNEDCPCFHSDPKFPDLEMGQKHVLRGWLSFYEGQDIQAEFKRIEATGWRHETGI